VNLIDAHIDRIRQLCSRHKVKKLFAFGSVLNDSFNADSDVDLVVDFSNVELLDYADNYFDFKEGLESLLNRPVDLLEDKAIRNPYLRKQIDLEKRLIFASQKDSEPCPHPTSHHPQLRQHHGRYDLVHYDKKPARAES
jgi:hypothetical protein